MGPTLLRRKLLPINEKMDLLTFKASWLAQNYLHVRPKSGLMWKTKHQVGVNFKVPFFIRHHVKEQYDLCVDQFDATMGFWYWFLRLEGSIWLLLVIADCFPYISVNKLVEWKTSQCFSHIFVIFKRIFWIFSECFLIVVRKLLYLLSSRKM